eukprot:TRINITY_DN2624_c0_g1_i1.p2 TRINITY_DN2624_c0_g1~~TRINITY_DN2624_c0_g1_i1.p2  ORF type:complete len:359 (+),score=83.29 TRINITY_DN2624_c0_g1_i1:41-1117(+)
MALTNRKWVISQWVDNREPTDADLTLVTEEIKPDEALQEGDFLVRLRFLSVDPYHRSFLLTGGRYGKSELGDVLHGEGAGEVVASRNPVYREGDLVRGHFGYQQYAVVRRAKDTSAEDERTEPPVHRVKLGVSESLGKFGMPSYTAFAGLKHVLRVQPGDIVFIGAASGAVGSVAGQVARHLGAKLVLGSVGTEEKLALIKQNYGYHDGLVYRGKTAGQVREEVLRLLAKHGVDAEQEGVTAYFENTGGPVTDAILQLIRPFGRIAICGQIEDYNKRAPESRYKYEAHILVQILMRQLRVEGFLWNRFPTDEADKYFAEHGDKLLYQEDVSEGIESARSALYGLFRGENLGKKLVRVA